MQTHAILQTHACGIVMAGLYSEYSAALAA